MKKILIGGIATVCALGTGMLAAATVISTPASLLLMIASGFVVTYSLPLIYQSLSRLWVRDKLNVKTISHKKYIRRLLERTDDLDDIDYKYARNPGLIRSFLAGVASLMISLALATSLYFIFALMPTSILMPFVAVGMFASLAIVTFMNYFHGIGDVWERRHSVVEAFSQMSSGWKAGVIVFMLSALAAGILVGAMTLDGVNTTLSSGISFLSPLAAIAGPIGRLVFAGVLVSTFSMMSYGFFELMDRDKLAEKKDMLRSFFTSSETYQNDLRQQWVAVNQEIAGIRANYTAAQDPRLDELFRQKDAIYHRYTVYRQPYFNFIYKSLTFLALGVTLAGMLMHVARGYQGLDTLFKTSSMGMAHSVATKLATGIMYLSILAESFFTAVIVGSTMNEEALLGKQTRQYEDHLRQQADLPDQAEDYFFMTSRGMHTIFETSLGLFGAEGADHGHGTNTGQRFADNPSTQGFMSFGMGLRAGYERHGGEHKLLTFRYNSTGGIQNIVSPKEVIGPDLSHKIALMS